MACVTLRPSMDSPTGLLTRFAQRCQPQLAVALVGIDVPPLVAARHHMVSGPGILDAYLACHRRVMSYASVADLHKAERLNAAFPIAGTFICPIAKRKL